MSHTKKLKLQSTKAADNGTLKSESHWKDIYGVYPEAIGEFLREHWLISIIAFVGAVASIIALLLM